MLARFLQVFPAFSAYYAAFLHTEPEWLFFFTAYGTVIKFRHHSAEAQRLGLIRQHKCAYTSAAVFKQREKIKQQVEQPGSLHFFRKYLLCKLENISPVHIFIDILTYPVIAFKDFRAVYVVAFAVFIQLVSAVCERPQRQGAPAPALLSYTGACAYLPVLS